MGRITLVVLAMLLVVPSTADAAMTRKQLTRAVHTLQTTTTRQERQIRLLKGRIVGIEERVSTLEQRTSSLESWKGICLAKQPVTRYGDWLGHLYGFTYTNSGGSISFQSALDFSTPATQPRSTSSGISVSRRPKVRGIRFSTPAALRRAASNACPG